MASTDGSTAITALWVPVVIFAHIFAFFWLVKTYLLHDPRALGLFSRKKKQEPVASNSVAVIKKQKATGQAGSEDVELALDKAISDTVPKADQAGRKCSSCPWASLQIVSICNLAVAVTSHTRL